MLKTTLKISRWTAARIKRRSLVKRGWISDGVMIHSKRGSETTFTMLAWDTSSSYVDNRPNLAPGPKTRE